MPLSFATCTSSRKAVQNKEIWKHVIDSGAWTEYFLLSLLFSIFHFPPSFYFILLHVIFKLSKVALFVTTCAKGVPMQRWLEGSDVLIWGRGN